MNAAEQQAFDGMRDALKHGIKRLNIWDKPLECMPLHEALSAAKAVLKPNREGMRYYKNDACRAEGSDSPDCICWTPITKAVQPQAQGKALQGLAAYLRCEAGGVFVGSPNHETLMQWAREVDAATEPQLKEQKDMTFEQWWDSEARTPAPDTYKNWEESCRLTWKAAQAAQPVQPGWKLVPVEPTDKMLTELFRGYVTREGAYKAMLKAAPIHDTKEQAK